MKKSVAFIGTLLIAASLCACNKRPYPKVSPTFSFNYFREGSTLSGYEPIDIEYFIVGNTYTFCIYVNNNNESFAYFDDFSFTYDEEAYDITPYYYKQEARKDMRFLFVIDVKKESNNNEIVVNHLKQTINEIDYPIRSFNERLNYCRYDNITKVDYNETTEQLMDKATVISSKEEMDQYPTWVSSSLAYNIDDSFFETSSLVYILLRESIGSYKYENYYIENDIVYFRISHYREGLPYDVMFQAVRKPWFQGSTAIALVIDKADGEATTNFDLWFNARIKN